MYSFSVTYVSKQLQVAGEYNIKGMYAQAGITVFKKDLLGNSSSQCMLLFYQG